MRRLVAAGSLALTIALALVPVGAARAGSDAALVLAFLSTYAAPALLHIVVHQLRRPLAIVVPPATPALVASAGAGAAQRDALLLAKERTLQRRRLGRRLVWDVGVWVLLVPVGGGGLVWAVGRMLERW